MVQRLILMLTVLALTVSLGTVLGSGPAEAQQQATITPEERKVCEDLKAYMDKFKALVRQSQGKERDTGLTQLNKDFGPKLDKLPAQVKTELAEWEKSCTRLYDAPASEEDQHAEAMAKNFGIMRQICGATLRS